jgi:predicted acyl esterase
MKPGTSGEYPALLEYIPYRKNDRTAWRDSIRHPYLAAHGYACVRVDMRGCGDSDGLMLDEYLPQELQDCLEVHALTHAYSLLYFSGGCDLVLLHELADFTC